MRSMGWLVLAIVSVAVRSEAQEDGDVEVPTERPIMGDFFLGIGGGAFNQDLGKVTSGGVAFTGRLGIDGSGPMRWFGVEASAEGLRTDSDVTDERVYNGILGLNARANLPVDVGGGVLKPYVIGGLGWSHISVNDALIGIGVRDEDTLAVPLGAGVSYYLGKGDGFAVDGRFVYNILTGERAPLIRTGDSWNVGLNVGARWGM